MHLLLPSATLWDHGILCSGLSFGVPVSLQVGVAVLA